jgi:hypothetical protein
MLSAPCADVQKIASCACRIELMRLPFQQSAPACA